MDRAYDAVIFGASGFTGQICAREFVQAGFQGSWALAGRSRSKLEDLAAVLEAMPSSGGSAAPGIIVADVQDAGSMAAMAQAARVVINCVGPFRFWGEPAVAACVAAGTDYLDICGEPDFLERMAFKYGAAAAAAGSYLASAVGFDSVPGDVGALWTASQFRPPARCVLVETFISIHSGASGFTGHFPTYESAVHGIAGAAELSALRRSAAAQHGRVDLKIPGPKPKRTAGPQFERRVGAWTVPFMGSDASVVRRTSTALAASGKPAYNCSVSLTLPSRLVLFLYLFFGAIFSWLARRPWGRRLLLAHPRLFTWGVFTHEGPSEQQLAETTFTMTNIASGYSQGAPTTPDQPPDLVITTRVAGPEPGYIACSIFVVAAAATLVQERGQLGVPPGAHTPAFLLQNTSYIERLRRRGITFETVSTVKAQ